MNLDERIKQHLEETTSPVQAPDRLDEVMTEGRRRRIRRNTFSVLGTAAVVAAVMSVTPLLLPDRSTGAPSAATQPDTPPSSAPPATTATTATTAAANIVPQGILTASSGTVAILETDGSTTAEFDLEGARTVYPDQAGGLVYGTDSGLRHLAGGDTTALAEGAVAIGPGQSGDGSPLFYYLSESDSVTALDLSVGETTPVTDLAEGEDATAGGTLVAVMDRSGDCTSLRLVDLDSGDIPSPLGEDCLPGATGVSVSTDGRYLGVLVGEDFRAMAIDSGETVLEQSYPDAYMATAGPGGWVIRTPSKTVLLAYGGESWDLPAVGQSDWAIPFARPLDGAGEETQRQEQEDGIADEEAACGAATLTASEQDLPDPVADTRQHLLDLVSACDSAALAQLSSQDGTHLSFGDVDPTSFWQDDERVALLAQLLATRPAHDADAGLWAWPAVQVDPEDEESWAEVAEIMDPDLVADMRQGGSYLGYRVGIADDGTWQYFVGGD